MYKLKITPRLYQEKLFADAVNKNSLIVLPTGLGKTLIALMLAIHRLNTYPESKILILAPTKPLAAQHLKSFVENSTIREDECALLTGAVKPEEREKEYMNKNIIFATPQTVENDIITRRIDLSKYSLIVFDECHKAVGGYAYCFIAKAYLKNSKNPRILGITASPGSSKEKIVEICENLSIAQVLHKSENSPDVKPYVKKKLINKVYLELPDELNEILRLLNKSLSTSLKSLKELGAINTHDVARVSKRDILMIQGQAVRQLQEKGDVSMYSVMSGTARVIKVMHALELLQTQGVAPLTKYFEGLKRQKTKAAKALMNDPDFRQAMDIAFKTSKEHPKFNELIKIIKLNPDATSLVFTQYRATAERIVDLLKSEDISTHLFVGQRGATGMSQKKQLEVLDKFRAGEFKTLVATSISEEGLDIPRIDQAVFFEPVPSALRSVQRKGRVGRAKTGKVYVLITKGTIDEKYYWSSYYKEKRMSRALKELSSEELTQQKLSKFF